MAQRPIIDTVTLTGQVVTDTASTASTEKVTQQGRATAMRAKVGDVVAVDDTFATVSPGSSRSGSR